ncbi:MAG: hypothetical protein LBQ22_12990 [Bacteroidales bacterium]|jgi:hypothetical protein|nr:hypothetical protein [Bacteroidales bacterium]
MKNRFKGLSFDEAKKLYRNLAKQCHPDKGGTPEEFHKLTIEFEEYVKSSNNLKSDKTTSTNMESLINELLNIVPEQYINLFTESSLYKVFSSGIISDALGFLGKDYEKIKSIENLIRNIKQ